MKYNLVIFFLFFFSAPLISQKDVKTELGVLVGGCNYIGELSPNLVFKETRYALGAFVKRNLSPPWTMRLGFYKGQFEASDANFSANKLRNLSVRTNLDELSLVMEYNFLPYALGILSETHTTYIFSGFGVSWYTPEALFQGNWVKLRDIGTEGQLLAGGKKYSTKTFSMPLGMGYKHNILHNTISLGVEVGYRYTHTDYLDDVSGVYPDFTKLPASTAALSDRSYEVNNDVPVASFKDQRGNPKTKDWYIIAGFTIAYCFPPPICPKF